MVSILCASRDGDMAHAWATPRVGDFATLGGLFGRQQSLRAERTVLVSGVTHRHAGSKQQTVLSEYRVGD